MNNFALLGLLYSSGSLKWGRNYKFELQTKRQELAEEYYKLLSGIGKADIKNKGIITVTLTGKREIENFLKGFRLIPPLDKEKIPVEILDTNEKRIFFLKGFFEGKSSIYPSKKLIRVSGKSLQLEKIKNLLEKEEVRSVIYPAGKYKSLYIEGKGRCESFRKIGFLSKEKNKLLDSMFGLDILRT